MLKLIIELIGDAFIIAFGAISLRFLFIPILIDGEVTLRESNIVALWIETILAGLIVLYGIWRGLDDFPKRKP